MGLHFGGGDKGDGHSPNAVWCITQSGRDEIQSSGGRGLMGKILCQLEDRGGTGTAQALALETSLDHQLIKSSLERMRKHGYVTPQN